MCPASGTRCIQSQPQQGVSARRSVNDRLFFVLPVIGWNWGRMRGPGASSAASRRAQNGRERQLYLRACAAQLQNSSEEERRWAGQGAREWRLWPAQISDSDVGKLSAGVCRRSRRRCERPRRRRQPRSPLLEHSPRVPTARARPVTGRAIPNAAGSPMSTHLRATGSQPSRSSQVRSQFGDKCNT